MRAAASSNVAATAPTATLTSAASTTIAAANSTDADRYCDGVRADRDPMHPG